MKKLFLQCFYIIKLHKYVKISLFKYFYTDILKITVVWYSTAPN